MTIKQIAELSEKSHQTVGRWVETAKSKMDSIRSKMDKANSRCPARFTLEETIAIVRAGGNQTLADLLLQNAQQTECQYRVNRLPNGKQLEQMRRIYGDWQASRRIDFLLGYLPSEEYLSPEQARTLLQLLRKRLKEKSGQPDLPGLGT